MIEYLKKVGAGKKRFKDLSMGEAYQAEKSIIEGKATDIQIGAFWSAQRIKYASTEELKGFINAHLEHIKHIKTDVKPLDIAINYDGKDRSVHILPASIFIAAGAGVVIGGHGAENVPSKYGITYYQILEKMGAKTPEKVETVRKSLETAGFGFTHQRLFAQKLFNLLPKRREFGLRTYHNTMERMLNPYKTDRVITGVSHPPYIEKYRQIALHTGFEKTVVFKSLEGGVEPFPNHETVININGRKITISNEGIKKEKILRKISPEENGKICLSVLKNSSPDYEEFAVLTASILIISYRITDSIEEGKELAKESLKSGKAYEKFKKYAQITQEE